jgi:predicted secreted protein
MQAMAERSTLRTPEVEKRIVEGLCDGVPLRELCRQDGMPNWRTVYEWISADEEFAARIAHARDLGFDAIAEEILDIADDGTNDWVERKRKEGRIDIVLDNEHVQRSKLRIETRLKLLAKWSPKKYGDKQIVDIGNKEGETLQVESKVVDPMVLAAVTEALLTKKTDQ